MITLNPTYEAAKGENEYFALTVTAWNKLQNLLLITEYTLPKKP